MGLSEAKKCGFRASISIDLFKKQFSMKKAIILLFVVSGFQSQSQHLISKDSINLFYDSLVYHLKTHYLYRDSVEWSKVDSIKEQALKATNFSESLANCTAVFDAINGSHLNLFSDHGYYKWSKGRQYVQEDFNINYLLKYEKQPGFEVQVIEDQYGYILMPSMLMLDLTQDSINLKTQRMYDEIMEINTIHKIKGWIIDLRFNSGGNVFPMLTALYHFLGDQTLYNCMDIEDELISRVNLKNGVINDSEDGLDKVIIRPTTKPNLKVPVALITGILTASAGELIPISFSGRANIITIGEPTAGFTTANSLTELPFDTKITLTTSFMKDKNYQYNSVITPDIRIEKEANFEDLSQDINIIEAIKFFESLGYISETNKR